MLKHSEIIENLSLDDKLSILTNGAFLATAHESNELLPSFCITDAAQLNASKPDEVYPSFAALANTWDVNAVQYVAKRIARRARVQGSSAVFLPKGNVRSNVYADGASEDPCLLGNLMGEYAKALDTVGVTPILSNCSLSNLDVAYADVKPNVKAIMEYYLKAFRIAAEGGENLAIATTYTPLKGDYERVNFDEVRKLTEKEIKGKKTFLFCEKTSADQAVASLNAGYPLCMDGHAHLLKEAVCYYQVLHDSVEKGIASAEELESAVYDGIALSEDVVDEAVDRVLEFAFNCQKHMAAKTASPLFKEEHEAISLAASTAVLLKNEGHTLPLSRDRYVAIIGQVAKEGYGESIIDSIAGKLVGRYTGYEDGYDLEKSRCDYSMARAKELARNADTIIVFLGFGEKRERTLTQTRCLKLPGSQIALLEELATLNKKIVAVVRGSGRVDMQFDDLVDAVLYMPEMGTYGGEAIAKLLTGEICPSGKLPFTIYDAPDERAATERFYKNNGYNKVGTFIGYRRYTSDEERVKYPFGHGLSYTTFGYSNLQVGLNGIYLTVKNTGYYEGTEIVQFYYSQERAELVRPKKELLSYAVVKLKPGESATIFHPFKNNDFSFYNPATKSWEISQGNYRVYASQSVADERLSSCFYKMGILATQSKEHLSDYLQGKSNIEAGGYFMDTKTKQEKHKNGGSAFGIIAILLGILCDVFIFKFAGDIDFFNDTIGKCAKIILLVSFNLLLLLGLISCAATSKKKKEFKQKQANFKVLKRDSNVQETEVKPVPYERLFTEEFNGIEMDDEEETEEETPAEDLFVIKEETDEYYRPDWKLEDMQADLISFLAARGFVLDALNARTLLSAMSVSRMVLLKTDKGANIDGFLKAFSQFFASAGYIDDASQYTTSDDLFYREGLGNGNGKPTLFAGALDNAAADTFAMKLACLTGVNLKTVNGYMTQFMRYIVKPELSYGISLRNKEAAGKTYTVTSNLWIMMALEENSNADEVHAYLAEPTAFVRLHFTESEGEFSEGKAAEHAISVAQFLSFGAKARNHFELEESKWKRVDKLEEYVQARAKYRISNKLWQKLEKYASVFLALGGESEQTLDSVIAVNMLVSLLSLIKNNKKEDDELFIHVLENIFGEDNVNICRSVIDSSAVDKGDVAEVVAESEKTEEGEVE